MKFKFLLTIMSSVLFFVFCSSSKKSSVNKTAITYTNNIQPLFLAKCAPCHFPEKGGKKTPFNTYEAVADEIDEIVTRVQLQPGQRHFMPKDGDRLSEKEIQMIKDWQAGGLVK